jgi:hypothetical protein
MGELPRQTSTDEPQTAMLLTQQEWDDLEQIARGYRMDTEWADRPSRDGKHPEETIKRRRRLATRIIEANR